jgi:hypothetical protein
MDHEAERKLAASLFNHAWDLMLEEDRTREEDVEMVHAAHASRYHWSRIGNELNAVVGEWQVSRVYTVLGRPEPALYHARRCLEICEANGIGGFHLAATYEALARAHGIAGEESEARTYASLAREVGETIEDEEDRATLERDFSTLPYS